MKKFIGLIAFALLTVNVLGQNARLLPWPEDKKAGLSITFDDNCPGQFTHARPTLDRKGYKATFFVITGSSQCGLRDWDTLRSVFAAGHEIGSHTVTHPQLHQQDTTTIGNELRNSYLELRSQISGLPDQLTIAWPYGRGGGSSRKEDTIRMLARPLYSAARNAGSGNGFDTYYAYQNPFYKDYYRQMGTYLMGPTITGTVFGAKVRDCLSAGGLMTLLYHGIETGGYNNIPNSLFEEHLDTLKNHPDLWVTTFKKLTDYHRQVNASTLNFNITGGPLPGVYAFQILDTLGAETVGKKIWVKAWYPAGQFWGVRQSGQLLPHQLIGPDTVMFEAIKDSVIYIDREVGIPTQRGVLPLKVYPNPASDQVSVDVPMGIRNGQLYLMDALGRKTVLNTVREHGNQKFQLPDLPSGMYQLTIEQESRIWASHLVISN